MQVLNLARDPRWGRNGEAGAEDPYLMSQYALQFTLGFQNDSAATTTRSRSTGTTEPQLPYLNGVVTLKHWDANTLEDSDGFTRHNFNANVSKFGLQDGYFKPFRVAIKEGDARGQ